MVTNTIVNLLKERRIATGFTQQQVADKIGIRLTLFQDIEQGERAMTLTEYYKTLRVLQLSESTIIGYLFASFYLP
ncbi:helix-turn-helix domain-containing protein [Vibrio profundum]|uniref:helix-turn-helix domain-containing protein n=1 Tax=Vibrio profundum TaxID=2910247 RepID=UPI003D0F57D6